jgi:gluconate 5-dehydrogenase
MTINALLSSPADKARNRMEDRLGSLFDLTGRTAVVTGGSRGLGLQVAQAFGLAGAHLALVARKPMELSAAADLLGALGVSVRAYPADLSATDGIDLLVQHVVADHGGIDILVNNAGATWGAPAESYPSERWRNILDLNLTGLFLLIQAVARQAFIPQGRGAVVNIASIEGLLGHHPSRVGTVAYNATKGAVVNMTRALAAEWGPRNIRVNALAPGFFATRMTAGTLDVHGETILAQTPLGKLGGDTDLMGPALLLASDAGAHITGQVLVVDGGATII